MTEPKELLLHSFEIFSETVRSNNLKICEAPAVEAAHNAFSNYRCLGWIVGLRHAGGETREFVAREFPLRVELIGKSNDSELVFRIEAFDLLNDLFGSHDLMLPRPAATFNPANITDNPIINNQYARSV